MKSLPILFLTTTLFFSSAVFAGKININNASAEQIAAALTGVGENRAKAIVEFRNKYGQFKSIDELEKVGGIGSKTVERNKDKITL